MQMVHQAIGNQHADSATESRESHQHKANITLEPLDNFKRGREVGKLSVVRLLTAITHNEQYLHETNCGYVVKSNKACHPGLGATNAILG